MKVFLGFIAGVFVGMIGQWFFSGEYHQTTGHNALSQRIQEKSRDSAAEPSRAVSNTDKIKDELAKTGRVIREKAKAAGDAIADAATNARLAAIIKTKLIRDNGLSAFKIDVDCTDGVATLAGTVATVEDINKAMDLALETEGIYKVVSTLQVKGS